MFPKSVLFLFSFVCCAVLSMTAFLHRSTVPYYPRSVSIPTDDQTIKHLRSIVAREEGILAKVNHLANRLETLEQNQQQQPANSGQEQAISWESAGARILSNDPRPPLPPSIPTSSKTALNDNAEPDTCQKLQTSSASMQLFMPYGAGCPHHMRLAEEKDTTPSPPEPLSISTIVPALTRLEFLESLPVLMKSIQQQTVPPNEVVIALSGVFDYFHIGFAFKLPRKEEFLPETIAKVEKFCQDRLEQYTEIYTKSPIKLICIGERLTAGRARMVAIRAASSDILAFVDADDEEIPIRNEVIQNVFNPQCSEYGGELKLFLHSARERRMHPYEEPRGYKSPSQNKVLPTNSNATCVSQEENISIYNGRELYRQVLAHKGGWRVANGVAYGHPVAKRSLFDTTMYTSINDGEDALFLRDCLLQLGPNKASVMYINRPLTTYYQRGYGNADIAPQKKAKNI